MAGAQCVKRILARARWMCAATTRPQSTSIRNERGSVNGPSSDFDESPSIRSTLDKSAGAHTGAVAPTAAKRHPLSSHKADVAMKHRGQATNLPIGISPNQIVSETFIGARAHLWPNAIAIQEDESGGKSDDLGSATASPHNATNDLQTGQFVCGRDLPGGDGSIVALPQAKACLPQILALERETGHNVCRLIHVVLRKVKITDSKVGDTLGHRTHTKQHVSGCLHNIPVFSRMQHGSKRTVDCLHCSSKSSCCAKAGAPTRLHRVRMTDADNVLEHMGPDFGRNFPHRNALPSGASVSGASLIARHGPDSKPLQRLKI